MKHFYYLPVVFYACLGTNVFIAATDKSKETNDGLRLRGFEPPHPLRELIFDRKLDEKPTCATVMVKCGENMQCSNTATGVTCECLPGYISNPDGTLGCISGCAAVRCAQFSECVVSPKGEIKCKCIRGYMKDSTGKCVPITGPGCAATTCLINTKCVENAFGQAKCVCLPGFVKGKDGKCIKDKCATVRCKQFSKCVVSPKGTASCKCIEGYKEDSTGACIPTTFAGCAAISCPTNSDCIEKDGKAKCVCTQGYHFNNDGICVRNKI